MKIGEDFDWWLVQTTDRTTEPFQRNTVQNTAIKTLDVYSLPTSRTCLTQISSVSQDTEHFPHTFISPTCFVATCTTPIFHKFAVLLKPWIRVT